MRDWLIGPAMTPEIEMNSNIHKYIFDKQHDEIFSEYHDIVGGVRFFTDNFWGNSFAFMTDVDKNHSPFDIHSKKCNLFKICNNCSRLRYVLYQNLLFRNFQNPASLIEINFWPHK